VFDLCGNCLGHSKVSFHVEHSPLGLHQVLLRVVRSREALVWASVVEAAEAAESADAADAAAAAAAAWREKRTGILAWGIMLSWFDGVVSGGDDFTVPHP
jgi:hypothetical protein